MVSFAAAMCWLAAGTAQAAGKEFFIIRGVKRAFLTLVPGSALIDEACNSRCQAFEALRKAASLATTPPPAESRNPGAVLCAQLGGKVLLGLDAAGNENGFCLFRDGSLTDSSSLSYYRLHPKAVPAPR